METELDNNQAINLPLIDLSLVETQIKLFNNKGLFWHDVGVLIDRDHFSTLVLLLDEDELVAVIRFSLSYNDSKKAISYLLGENGKIYLKNYQSENFSIDTLNSISAIRDKWESVLGQDTPLSLDEITEFFEKIETGCREKGRGDDFTTETKRQVMFASHGLCMFEGCGEDLGFDNLTGYEGNFSYLAHNISSSERGTRAVPVLSGKLSNEPQNILLLCDKHHRLVDKVAQVEFPADRLAKMRQDFINVVRNLLDGVAYQPIPAYAVLWPVQRNVISAPSALQINQCLALTKQRLKRQLHDLSDNETMLREFEPSQMRDLMPSVINSIAEKLLSQLHSSRYRSALFAFGTMSSLIGLGARLGNKNEIMPMLRYRDGGQWCWPAEKPNRHFFEVLGEDELTSDEKEVVVKIIFTANPKKFDYISEEERIRDVKSISIVLKEPSRLGNGAIRHPVEGLSFMWAMHGLFMRLKDRNNIHLIHLLTCASNAACIFLGQAYDVNQPEILVYDFENEQLIPFLKLKNVEQRCTVSKV